MNTIRCALLLAAGFGPLLIAPGLSVAGPLGLLPSKKSAATEDSSPRSVYARGKGKSDTHYQPVAAKSKKPNIFQRMGQGTRNVLGSTKDALTFKKKAGPAPVSGKTKSFSPKKAQQKESSSWFGSWFKKKEEDKPQTMKEWMKQDRVEY